MCERVWVCVGNVGPLPHLNISVMTCFSLWLSLVLFRRGRRVMFFMTMPTIDNLVAICKLMVPTRTYLSFKFLDQK